MKQKIQDDSFSLRLNSVEPDNEVNLMKVTNEQFIQSFWMQQIDWTSEHLDIEKAPFCIMEQT